MRQETGRMRAQDLPAMLDGIVKRVSARRLWNEHVQSADFSRESVRAYVSQMSLFTRHSRQCWAAVVANCPVMEVRQFIVRENLYTEEANEETSHYNLLSQLGRAVGMSQEEIDQPEALPTTRVALMAWEGLTKARPWVEGLAAKAILERFNDPASGVKPGARLMLEALPRLGLGGAALGFAQVHAVADLEHGSTGYKLIERHVDDCPAAVARVIEAAEVSAEAFRLMSNGMVEKARSLMASR